MIALLTAATAHARWRPQSSVQLGTVTEPVCCPTLLPQRLWQWHVVRRISGWLLWSLHRPNEHLNNDMIALLLPLDVDYRCFVRRAAIGPCPAQLINAAHAPLAHCLAASLSSHAPLNPLFDIFVDTRHSMRMMTPRYHVLACDTTSPGSCKYILCH